MVSYSVQAFGELNAKRRVLGEIVDHITESTPALLKEGNLQKDTNAINKLVPATHVDNYIGGNINRILAGLKQIEETKGEILETCELCTLDASECPLKDALLKLGSVVVENRDMIVFSI